MDLLTVISLWQSHIQMYVFQIYEEGNGGFLHPMAWGRGKWSNCQDLSYGEILAGRPGAWLVEKIFFYMHAIKKDKRGTYI